jgi:hypothetical protein
MRERSGRQHLPVQSEVIKAPGLDKQNLPPPAGMQFFGHVKIDGQPDR